MESCVSMLQVDSEISAGWIPSWSVAVKLECTGGSALSSLRALGSEVMRYIESSYAAITR